METILALGSFLARLPGWGVWIAAALFVAAAVTLYLVRVRRRAPSVLRELSFMVVLALVLGGACLPLSLVPATASWHGKLLRGALVVGVALAVYGLCRILVAGIRAWSGKSEAIRSARGPLEVMARLACLLVGGMILMDAFHLSITPFLTTLGIGSLAVALALQETLANFFAGLYLAADRPIRLGDFVKLDNGDEGYVDGIGWRSTRLRTLANNTIVIPNDRLAKSVITNYDLPAKRTALLMRVSVSYREDSRRVEKILVEVAKAAVGKVDGLVGDPEPFVRFIPGFGPSALEFTLVCQIAHHVDQYLVQHELRHRILERFRRERIEIPVPESVIRIRQDGARGDAPLAAEPALSRGAEDGLN